MKLRRPWVVGVLSLIPFLLVGASALGRRDRPEHRRGPDAAVARLTWLWAAVAQPPVAQVV
jgi:hypothetical protein